MNDPKLIRLMHEVLDGEASPEDARELARRVAADPGARATYEELQRLFEAIGRVPKAFPPEGLVAAVMAKLPARIARQDRPHQLFSQSGVIGASSDEIRGIRTGSAARVQRTSDPNSHVGGNQMNDEQKRGSFSKNKVWIGIGLALAGVVVATQYFNFPPTSETTSGTIVPAQRYRAEQPTAADVKVGDATTGSGQTAPTGVGSGADAAKGELSKGELSKGQLSKGELSKGELSKGELSKGELSKGVMK
jgi:anti-sigma factor RsiW